jgi:hypothetical protein
MRKLLSAACAAAVVFVAGAAFGDAYVTSTTTQTKTRFVFETININKFIFTTVNETIRVDAVAEQLLLKNQRNQYNYVQDEDGTSTATISSGSYDEASGILLINQAPGYINNQGNEVSVTYANSPEKLNDSRGVFVHAQIDAEQINGFEPAPENATEPSTVPVNEYQNALGGSSTDLIDGSFNDASGVVGVNQSAGSLNNQNNAVAIALGDFAVYALGEANLGQFNTWNVANTFQTVRADTVTGSFSGFTGIAAVNQSAGAINNQANLVDVAVSLSGLPTLPQ